MMNIPYTIGIKVEGAEEARTKIESLANAASALTERWVHISFAVGFACLGVLCLALAFCAVWLTVVLT